MWIVSGMARHSGMSLLVRGYKSYRFNILHNLGSLNKIKFISYHFQVFKVNLASPVTIMSAIQK